MKFKSIFISDLHLNTQFCQAEILTQLLKDYQSDNLFLVGDILDLYVKGINLPKTQINVIRKILTKAKRGTNVVYILGNHDDSLKELLDYEINIEGIKIVKEYVYETNDKHILLTHGHIADLPIVSHLYMLGDFCYTLLLHLNSIFNWFRKKLGLKYFSLSQKIKNNVKDAIKFIENYEDCIIKHTKSNNCSAVISGHIHNAEIKLIDNIVYMNTGDFVESCTAIVEDYEGNFSLLKYQDNEFIKIKEYSSLTHSITIY